MPWDKVRNDIAVVIPVPEGQAVGVRGAVAAQGDGGFALTYIGTTDTDYDGPLDDPQCTPDDIEYLLQAINFSVREPLDRGRRPRHVGRSAPAGEGGDERAHRRPVAAPPGHPLGVRA